LKLSNHTREFNCDLKNKVEQNVCVKRTVTLCGGDSGLYKN